MAETDHSSKLLAVLSVAALLLVDFEVSADQRGRPLQRYRNDDNDDDDMTFSGDVDGSGGSGLEPTDHEHKMVQENCSHKNKSACVLQRRTTIVPVYGTGSRTVTRKVNAEDSVTSSYRSLLFSPVRSTAMTSSRLPSREQALDHSTVTLVTGQLPCNSASSSRSDCIRTSGSTEDDDIEIVEEISEIIGNETKTNSEETANYPDESLVPVTTTATSSEQPVTKYWTKTSTSSISAASTASSVELQLSSNADQHAMVDLTTLGVKTEHPSNPLLPEMMLHTESPIFVDYNDVVTRYEIDSRPTTNRVRLVPVGFATPDGFAIQLHASSERYAALVLNVALLTGIALLLILFIVVLACLILYRRRRTRCGTNDVMTTPPGVASSCHRSGVTSSASHQPTIVHTRMMIDARRPPAYQPHPVDDQRLFDAGSIHSSVAGSRVKVGGDPREWFV